MADDKYDMYCDLCMQAFSDGWSTMSATITVNQPRKFLESYCSLQVIISSQYETDALLKTWHCQIMSIVLTASTIFKMIST